MRQADMSPSLRALVAVICLCAPAGCASVRGAGKSLLQPPPVTRDTIAMEKYSVRFNHGDPDLNDRMWSEIDEECLPPAVRARLAANGFRVGVIGAHLPEALERVLNEPQGSALSPPAPPPPQQAINEQGLLEPKPIDLARESRVRRGLWQTHAGHQGLIITAGEQTRIPRLAVLVRGDDGQVTGRQYERVMGALVMKVFPEPDGRVHFDLVPQLEHGDPKSRFTASDGMIKPEYRPEAVVFKDLRMDARLSPGQMLIITSRAEKPGSLGDQFFSEQAPGQPLEQKLLLVRLAQAPAGNAFAVHEIPAAAP
jgi:hypothetical protein